MPITVNGPGGVTINFPDGTDNDTINRVMREAVGGAPQQKPSEPVNPLRQKAEEEVRAFRQAHPIATTVDDTVRRLARGTGIGSWLDEGNALLSSGMHAVGLGGRPYEEAIEIERAKDRIGDEESTVVGSLPVIGDVSAGGLTKLAGGIASAPVTPMLRVAQGRTLLPMVANTAATGAAYGGLYGAGEGETGEERATNAAIGTGFGFGLGVATPPLAAGVGNAVAGVRNRLAPMPQDLAPFSRSAVDRVANVATDMDNLTPRGFQQQARRLGPEGMLADMGDNLTTVTEGIAQQPGQGRRIITEALETRAGGAPQRIQQQIDQSMGPAVNIPQTITRLEQQYGAQAAPLYEQFYQTAIPNTKRLQGLYERARASGAVDRAEQLMLIDGFDPAALRAKNLTGREWDYIKRGIDDLASQAERRGLNEGVRRFGNLARAIRSEVDRTISPKNPRRSIWAQARSIAGEGIGARAAISEGQRAFNRGLSADQLEADMAARSALERDAFKVGAREQLRSNMANAATNFGPRGDAAARRMLNSEENRRKMATIVGQQKADEIASRIDAENAMAETFNQVMGNSATARREATRSIVPRQYDQSRFNEVGKKSFSGMVVEGLARITNFLTAGALNERNARVAADMAEMLVAQGMRRDRVAQALLTYANRQQMTQAQKQRIEGFVRDFMRGATPTAIGSAVSQ